MKKFKRNSIVSVIAIASLVLSMAGPTPARAATLPVLGAASTFSVLSQTTITGTVPVSGISGDVGLNAAGAGITALTTPMVTGTIYSTDGAAPSVVAPLITALTVQADALAAYTTDIPGQGTNGTIVGALDGQTFTPGVYDWTGPGPLVLGGGTVTLNGAGVYIFRSATNFTSAGTVNLIGGARACDVFWRVQTNAAINGTAFVGTILSGTTIAFGAGVALDGRALGVGPAASVTFAGGTDVISGPTCGGGGHQQYGTINVVKTVINDNGGTKKVADFPLFVNGNNVVSGETNTFTSGNTYSVTETSNSNYVQTFSGDCDSTGSVVLNEGENKLCIITNNDIGAPVVPPVPPLIDVVKVPSPLALPNGPGPVEYTYTLRNIGTVPVTDITMVGDTCKPINLISGDINVDSILQVNETWVYKCTTTLLATHTNTVVATGWANGISANDIASATVVVGIPIVPPLIHITKVPSPLRLLSAGGAVTYTYTVTNPGSAPLSNVSVTDDKCTGLPGLIFGHPGDLNKNNLLDSNETWIFTCKSNLLKTTTNIGTATGSANGLTAKDFAIATVVVAIPGLPNTGLPPKSTTMLVGFLMLVSASLVLVFKKRTV